MCLDVSCDAAGAGPCAVPAPAAVSGRSADGHDHPDRAPRCGWERAARGRTLSPGASLAVIRTVTYACPCPAGLRRFRCPRRRTPPSLSPPTGRRRPPQPSSPRRAGGRRPSPAIDGSISQPDTFPPASRCVLPDRIRGGQRPCHCNPASQMRHVPKATPPLDRRGRTGPCGSRVRRSVRSQPETDTVCAEGMARAVPGQGTRRTRSRAGLSRPGQDGGSCRTATPATGRRCRTLRIAAQVVARRVALRPAYRPAHAGHTAGRGGLPTHCQAARPVLDGPRTGDSPKWFAGNTRAAACHGLHCGQHGRRDA